MYGTLILIVYSMQQLGLKTEVSTVHLFYFIHLYVTVCLFALFMLVSLIHLPYIDSHNFFIYSMQQLGLKTQVKTMQVFYLFHLYEKHLLNLCSC